MDSRFLTLIRAYQAAIAHAVELLMTAGVPRPASGHEWATTNYPHLDQPIDNHYFYKHGYGCAIVGPKLHADLDFGQNGEITGFTYSRLWQFASRFPTLFGFSNEQEIEAVFVKAHADGALTFSGYILYYLSEPEPTRVH